MTMLLFAGNGMPHADDPDLQAICRQIFVATDMSWFFFASVLERMH